MVAASQSMPVESGRPIDLTSSAFQNHKREWYAWLRDESPVCAAKIAVVKLNVVSRYEDCMMVLTDERFVRNRARAKGKAGTNPLPFPLPRSLAALGNSMIIEDDPEHRRHRSLVNKAFTARAVGRLEDRVEALSHELLDRLEAESETDLLESYAHSIPTRVIAEIMGLSDDDMAHFERCLSVLTRGLSGLSIVRTIFWDLRGATKFVRELCLRKRADPADDMLSALIEAEEEGDRLTEDELVAMVFLLIVAGFETTKHLIGNSVRTLLEHPSELARLREDPSLWESGVDELVRYCGPIHGTKMQYATEDVTLHDVTIKRGTPTMPLLGAANFDPRAFDDPDRFDVARSPNHHLGFGFGAHFCLGKQLARMEARVALRNLFERFPQLRLAVEPNELEIARFPGWHRHRRIPVSLKG